MATARKAVRSPQGKKAASKAVKKTTKNAVRKTAATTSKGTPKAAGTAAGFTGLFGYLGGAVAANAMLGYTVDHFGWDGGFLVLTISCVLSIVLLALTLKHENISIAHKAAADKA